MYGWMDVLPVSICLCLCTYVFVCMYVCMYVCICVVPDLHPFLAAYRVMYAGVGTMWSALDPTIQRNSRVMLMSG